VSKFLILITGGSQGYTVQLNRLAKAVPAGYTSVTKGYSFTMVTHYSACICRNKWHHGEMLKIKQLLAKCWMESENSGHLLASTAIYYITSDAIISIQQNTVLLQL